MKIGQILKVVNSISFIEKTRIGSASSSFIAKLDSENDEDADVKVTSDISDFSDEEDDESRERKERLSPIHSQSQTNQNENAAAVAGVRLPNAPIGQSASRDSNNSSQSNFRPKIWSIDEIMNKDKTISEHSRVPS